MSRIVVGCGKRLALCIVLVCSLASAGAQRGATASADPGEGGLHRQHDGVSNITVADLDSLLPACPDGLCGEPRHLTLLPQTRDDSDDRQDLATDAARFWQWLSINGVAGLDNVQLVKHTSELGLGLGLQAAREVLADTVAFAVPTRLRLSAEAVRGTAGVSFSRALDAITAAATEDVSQAQAHDGWMVHAQPARPPLVLALVHERFYRDWEARPSGLGRNQSLWEPYLRLLPASFPTTPTMFSPTEAALLPLSLTLERAVVDFRSAVRWCQRLAVSAMSLAPEVFGNPVTDQELQSIWETQVEWAMHIVASRAYGPRFEGDAPCALVPLADLANHAMTVPSITGVVDSYGLRGYLQASKVSLEPGMALLSRYDGGSSQICNYELLTFYGFASSDPAYDCARFIFAHRCDTVRAESQNGLCDLVAKVLPPGFSITGGHVRGAVAVREGSLGLPSLMALARVFHLETERESSLALKRYTNSTSQLLGVVSLRNELYATRTLLSWVDAIVAQKKTALEQAETNGEPNRVSINRKNVLAVVHGEIRVLVAAREQVVHQWTQLLATDGIAIPLARQTKSAFDLAAGTSSYDEPAAPDCMYDVDATGLNRPRFRPPAAEPTAGKPSVQRER